MTPRPLLVPLVSLTLTLAVASHADVLELRDGRILHGTYLGGTGQTVRFRSAESPEVFTVSEIIALTFTSDTTASTPPPPAPVSSPSGPITLPAGTPLIARLLEPLDSSRNETGDRFDAELVADVKLGDTVVLPAGTRAVGTILEASRAGRLKGKAVLVFAITEVMVQGKPLNLKTSPQAEVGEGAGTIKTVAKSAVVGEVLNDDAGTSAKRGLIRSAASKGEQISYSAGTILQFDLAEPLALPR